MFIRQCNRLIDGKRQSYWALVESRRTARGPRQRVVAWLGKLDEAGRLASGEGTLADKVGGVVKAAADKTDESVRQRLSDSDPFSSRES